MPLEYRTRQLRKQERLKDHRRIFDRFVAQDRVGAAMGEAARWGDIDYLQQRLDAGASVNIRAENGGTPLIHAASGGQQKCIRFCSALERTLMPSTTMG
jgi:ankyrin repeat protein